MGENDMSFGQYRHDAAQSVRRIIEQSRKELGRPTLRWVVSQQLPTDSKEVNGIDVVADFANVAKHGAGIVHLPVFDLPTQELNLVLDAKGTIALGLRLARAYFPDLEVSKMELALGKTHVNRIVLIYMIAFINTPCR